MPRHANHLSWPRLQVGVSQRGRRRLHLLPEHLASNRNKFVIFKNFVGALKILNFKLFRYVLVGYNAINATKVGLQSVLVPPDQQIRAQVGDFVGIFYEKPGITGAIPYAAAAQSSDSGGS